MLICGMYVGTGRKGGCMSCVGRVRDTMGGDHNGTRFVEDVAMLLRSLG